MGSRDEVSRFIRSTFRSVWSLELLLLLKNHRRAWKQPEIIAAMRASDLIVAEGLDVLSAAGLVIVDEAGEATYSPVSEAVGALVDTTEAFYARSPDAVRRLIISARTSGLTAFADAFLFRKD